MDSGVLQVSAVLFLIFLVIVPNGEWCDVYVCIVCIFLVHLLYTRYDLLCY